MRRADESTADPAANAGERWFQERLAQLTADARDARARTAVLETPRLRRGTMPPLYVHDENETYYVLEGWVTFYVGGEVVAAREGQVVVAPAGVARTFCVESERARWLVMTSLSSLARYEDFSRAVAQPAGTRWPSDEEAAAVRAIAAANGIEILGPPGALPAAA
jgi:mannose-6-phosphate isomerase-like protein (cupin superfamily)